MKIFIDFDDVLFNTKLFKRDLIKVFLKNGLTKAEFENSYYVSQKKAEATGQYYDPKKQIAVLKKQHEIDVKKLGEDLENFLSDLRKYVFLDVAPFLDNFYRKNLFLITYGHTRFQFKKIHNSRLHSYFSRIIITKKNKIDKIMEITRRLKLESGEPLILIDDRPDQLETAKKRKKSILTFRLCRPQGRYSDLICLEKDYEVTNLKKILKILKEEGYMDQ